MKATKIPIAASRNQKIFSHEVTQRDTKKKNGSHFRYLKFSLEEVFQDASKKFLPKKQEIERL